MWDPLLNEFPESVHGFRCMLAIKYLQALEETYEPNTLGHDLTSVHLICVIRARDYVEATRRYNHFHSRLEVRRSCTSTARSAAVLLSHCPRHKQATIMDVPAHVSKAQNVQNVQKS
uniref:Protein V2 n=1 Tax=East African cassava mosaic Malawi virus TaxID=223264 RepID=U5KI48_9GEMI|nr:AV2 [East African cassava mosaic Malawi virus]